MLDEFNEDVAFLAHGVLSGNLTDLHQEYLDAFYEEEFDDPESALASTQKRPMVARQKIRAYLARIESTRLDPSSRVEAMRTVQKVYSGFVHGASPHIMDMYLGMPPRWHLRGMSGTYRANEHQEDLSNSFYRSIASFALAAKAFGDDVLFNSVFKYMRDFAAAAGENYFDAPTKSEA
jgi:hypothetical protein